MKKTIFQNFLETTCNEISKMHYAIVLDLEGWVNEIKCTSSILPIYRRFLRVWRCYFYSETLGFSYWNNGFYNNVCPQYVEGIVEKLQYPILKSEKNACYLNGKEKGHNNYSFLWISIYPELNLYLCTTISKDSLPFPKIVISIRFVGKCQYLASALNKRRKTWLSTKHIFGM